MTDPESPAPSPEPPLTRRVGLRVLAALIALAAGISSLVVAIDLLRGVLA